MGSKPAILVTRPEDQGAALCSALDALGFTSHSLPLLELRAMSALSPAARRSLDQLDQFQHILFISGNAVHFGMTWIAQRWPNLPKGLQWYAIGGATAARLEQYAVTAQTSGESMTTESLLEHPNLQALAGQRVLIVKGLAGRVSLREGLESRGASVSELDCYTRQRPTMAAGELLQTLDRWHIALTLISSGEGLENFISLLGGNLTPAMADIPLIVPSTRVAQSAAKSGFNRVEVATNASDRAMIDAVKVWWRRYPDTPASGVTDE